MSIQNMKRQAGFSLLEVMTTVLLVAILGGASVPVLGNLYSTYRLRASIEGLVGEIQLAKFKAINLNSTLTLTINGNDKTYQLAGEGLRYLDTSVSFQGTPPSTIQFDSRGRLTSGVSTSLVLVGSGGTATTITVNPSGRVSVN